MAPGVPGGLSEPSMFGTIDGAGIPPSAALSPGIPSSGGDSNKPPAQAGCRHPNHSHAGSSWTAFAGTDALMRATPAIAPATTVLASVPRTPEAIIESSQRIAAATRFAEHSELNRD
jgi:hypothetical protein